MTLEQLAQGLCIASLCLINAGFITLAYFVVFNQIVPGSPVARSALHHVTMADDPQQQPEQLESKLGE